MSPGGHLATTAAACAATGILGAPALMVAGVALGGFLIDVDHAVDYVLFEGQKGIRPASFLRYYVGGRPRRLVLMLHSYELFTLLGILALWSGSPWLAGYLLGGLMHLGLDIAFNGQLTPKSIWAFYCFAYRARHRFAAPALFGDAPERSAGPRFWRNFFRGARPLRAPTLPCATSWDGDCRRAPGLESRRRRLERADGPPSADAVASMASPVQEPQLVQHGRHGRIVTDRGRHVPPAKPPVRVDNSHA